MRVHLPKFTFHAFPSFVIMLPLSKATVTSIHPSFVSQSTNSDWRRRMKPFIMVLLALILYISCALFPWFKVHSLQLSRNPARLTNSCATNIRHQDHGALWKHIRPSSFAERDNDKDKKLSEMLCQMKQTLHNVPLLNRRSTMLNIVFRGEPSPIWELNNFFFDMTVSKMHLRNDLHSKDSNGSNMLEQLRCEYPHYKTFSDERLFSSPHERRTRFWGHPQ